MDDDQQEDEEQEKQRAQAKRQQAQEEEEEEEAHARVTARKRAAALSAVAKTVAAVNAAVAAEYGENLRSKGITPRSPVAGVPPGLSSSPSPVVALTTNIYKVDPVIWNTLTPADQALLDNADPAAAKAFIDSL